MIKGLEKLTVPPEALEAALRAVPAPLRRMGEILPGEELIATGLRDLAAGRETVEALLVAVGEPRLRDLGIDLPSILPASPEQRLYARLLEIDPEDAYGQYNALIRRLVSFERAAECIKQGTMSEWIEKRFVGLHG